MLTSQNLLRRAQHCAAALLVCGAAAVFAIGSTVSAQPDAPQTEQIRFDVPVVLDSTANAPVRDAVAKFLTGMAEGDAPTVWLFASEEDQEAFSTEAAVFAAFSDAFPVLTQVQDVAFESFRSEGDTPFVELFVRDQAGHRYQATLGLWLDDAGDWKIISCDVKPVTDQVAAL